MYKFDVAAVIPIMSRVCKTPFVTNALLMRFERRRARGQAVGVSYFIEIGFFQKAISSLIPGESATNKPAEYSHYFYVIT